ncbi:MAG: thiamine-phosphate kinase [Alistipes putredinis]|nr:MAG: thiamine-phosphate kinase [Alistipes putredinis]
MNDKRTEIATLGEFGLIDRITGGLKIKNASTVMAAGDDAAVIAADENTYTLLSSDLLLEGVNFDLTYFPLRHLGYKTMVVGCSDILAMNGTPTQATVSLGISAKLSVEQIDELYEGIGTACDELGMDLVGGDTSASVNGLTIAVSVLGRVGKDKITYRSGARPNDLICITSDLGAAYMGLHLLEREKRALAGQSDPQPQFKGYEYLLERQLKPRARKDVIDILKEESIVPTSMIDISDGLASDLLQICKSSDCGARIYLDRLPIAKQTYALCEELHADPWWRRSTAATTTSCFFTVPLSMQEKVMRLGAGVEVIGHITDKSKGAALVTPDGSDITIKAQGFHGN